MNSPDLPRWMWRDPAEVAERVEAGTCQGCGWTVQHQIGGACVEACAKGRRYGKKCRFYVEAKK